MSNFSDSLQESEDYQEIMDAGGRAVWISGLSNSKEEREFSKLYIARKLNCTNTGGSNMY